MATSLEHCSVYTNRNVQPWYDCNRWFKKFVHTSGVRHFRHWTKWSIHNWLKIPTCVRIYRFISHAKSAQTFWTTCYKSILPYLWFYLTDRLGLYVNYKICIQASLLGCFKLNFVDQLFFCPFSFGDKTEISVLLQYKRRPGSILRKIEMWFTATQNR